MLYSIVFALVIIVSIICIIYIFSKKITVVESNFSKEEKSYLNLSKNNRKLNLNYRFFLNSFIRFCERFFRLIKIFALKIDNNISKLLKKLNNFKTKNFTVPNIEKDSFEIVNKAETMNFSQLKNVNPKPQVKYDMNIANILGERENKIVEKNDANKEAIVEIDNKDLYSEEECIKIISKNPRNLKAYHLLADVYIKQKNYNDAKLSLQQILKFDLKNVDAKLKLRQLRDLQNKVK